MFSIIDIVLFFHDLFIAAQTRATRLITVILAWYIRGQPVRPIIFAKTRSQDITDIVRSYYTTDTILSCYSLHRSLKLHGSISSNIIIGHMRKGVLIISSIDLDSEYEIATQTPLPDGNVELDELPGTQFV